MGVLETQVREALIEQRTDELVKYSSEISEWKSIVTELVEIVTDSMVNSIVHNLEYGDEKDVEEMKKEYKREVIPEIQAHFDDPKQLRETMYEQAKKQYKSVRQLEAEVKSFSKEMIEQGIDEGAIAGYEKACEGLFEFVRTNDKMIMKLVKIAETEGVDKAIQKDTRYAIIRDMFSTPDEYRAFAQSGIEAAKNLFSDAQTALMSDGEMGKVVGGVFEATGKIMEKALEIAQKIEGNYLEKTIKEIYG